LKKFIAIVVKVHQSFQSGISIANLKLLLGIEIY